MTGPGGGQSPLTLTLDASAIPPRAAGAGQYVLALVRGLADEPSVASTVISRRDDTARWRDAGARRLLASAPASRPMRLAWEQLGLPHLLKTRRPDVHHGPHYTMPERSAVPAVVTIHDCTFFDHPEWHQRSKVLVFRRAIRVAARRAAALICVSGVTAERLQAVCDVRAPVVVAPHGVDHDRFAPQEPASGADRADRADRAVLAALGLEVDRPYVAFVGTLEPRKNVATLVRAFDRLATTRPELQLVLAGQRGWGNGELDRALAASRVADRVALTGYVPDDAVPALLRQSAAVAYPSAGEGYGLPALEALACGAPLVTTEGTAMAEVAGGAALLVPSAEPGPLAEALAELLDQSPSAAAARRQAGLAAAAAHTWAASVTRHLEAYRLAAARGAPGKVG